MSKLSREAARKFHAYEKFNKSNMRVDVDEHGNAYMYQHGNKIAIKKRDGSLYVSNAGWFSKTTKERLNDVMGPGRISQRNYNWYLNGTLWDGSWMLIINADPVSIAVKAAPSMQ